MHRPERILIIRTDRIGDAVLATPLVRAVRASFPNAFVAVMTRPYASAVFAGNPRLDEIITDDPYGRDRGTRGMLRQARRLRTYRFDTALLLLPTSRLAWMLFLAGIPRRIGVGSKIYERLTFMRTVSREGYVPLRHEADYCLDLGRAVGVVDRGLATEIFLGEEEKLAGLRLLEDAGSAPGSGGARLVGIHPGSGRSSPNWRPERYADLAGKLLERGHFRIVLTGSAGEAEYSKLFEGFPPGRVVDLVGKLELRELFAVIHHLDVLVSASTGPMHAAAALGVPTVSLFCPLPACSPELWGPRGNRSITILPAAEFCRGSCPGDPHVCDLDEGVTAETVVEAVEEITADAY
jgi:heptosyltransferase-2